jgi:outer membrane receptor protein involved in Fe transport
VKGVGGGGRLGLGSGRFRNGSGSQVLEDHVCLAAVLHLVDQLLAGAQHVGKRLGETGTTFELPGYTLFRAFTSWRPNDDLEVFGEVDDNCVTRD